MTIEYVPTDISSLLRDLRTPLSTLELSAGLLARRPLPPELDEVVRRLRTATHDVMRLAERALTLSRAAANGMPARVELMTICEHVIDQVRLYHPDRRITLCGRRPVLVYAEAHALQEVVRDLVVDALTRGDGDVTVEATGDLLVVSRGPGDAPVEITLRPC